MLLFLLSLEQFLHFSYLFLGIGMFALPEGILSAGFIEVIRKRKELDKTCPYCGEKLD